MLHKTQEVLFNTVGLLAGAILVMIFGNLLVSMLAAIFLS